ncbi:MAG: hypothetical protein EXQ96_06545 [Alphaproteobacteria bacterium]|nr:hypothetical protein [Alphaproteobacteria bacterium]
MKLLSQRVKYEGSAAHKRNQGDFSCPPPRGPRPDKTLCDGGAIFQKAVAVSLLRDGLRRGLVSAHWRGEWPQNVWAMIDGKPLQADLSNREQGIYHGYPMDSANPLGEAVLERWHTS